MAYIEHSVGTCPYCKKTFKRTNVHKYVCGSCFNKLRKEAHNIANANAVAKAK
jgi:hypothetical protein